MPYDPSFAAALVPLWILGSAFIAGLLDYLNTPNRGAKWLG